MNIKDTKELFARDVTKITPLPKSEVTRRLEALIIQDRTKIIEEVIEMAERKKKEVPNIHRCTIQEYKELGSNQALKDLQEALSKLKE